MARMKTDAASFLESHHIITYLQDSIAQLLLYKDENPKVNVKKFFSDYFACVRDSNHTLYRKYEFIAATPHNRASFVRTFWKAFRHLGKRGDLLSLAEYHSLLTLLCPNFPFDVVLKVGRIVLQDDAIDCLVSFPDFLFAFQIQFLYSEFVARCLELHEALLNGDHSSAFVVMPDVGGTSSESTKTDGQQPKSHSAGDSGRPRREGSVSTPAFMRLLQGVCERREASAPDLTTIKRLFTNISEITYYEFLITLCKSDEINADIGIIQMDAKFDNEEDFSTVTSTWLKEETTTKRPTQQVSPSVRPNTASRSGRADPVPAVSQSGTRSRPGTAGKSRSMSYSGASSSGAAASRRKQVHTPVQRRGSASGLKRNKKPVVVATEDEDDDDDDSSTVGTDSDTCASSGSDDVA